MKKGEGLPYVEIDIEQSNTPFNQFNIWLSLIIHYQEMKRSCSRDLIF